MIRPLKKVKPGEPTSVSKAKIEPGDKLDGSDTYRILVADTLDILQKDMDKLSKEGWKPAVGSIGFRYTGKPNGPNKLRLFIVMTRLYG